MYQKEEVFERFRNSLIRVDGHLHMVSSVIPAETQAAYFHAMQKERATRQRMGLGQVSDVEADEAYLNLCNELSELNQKKHAIALLAMAGTIRAYRQLEACAGEVEGEVADWVRMAFSEVSVGLQVEFLEEPHVLIASGLGGKGDRMRFFSLFRSNGNMSFEDYQRRLIEKEFAYTLPREGCEIDRLKIGEQHVELLLFVPVAVDFFRVIGKLVEECNQYGNFLSPQIFVTNVKKMTEDEIERALRVNT
jgi:hypothetical protein